MTLNDIAKTSFSNLGRHPVRTILSSIGVTVGIVTIVTMVSLGIGVQNEVIRTFKEAGLERVTVRPVVMDPDEYNPYAEPEREVIISPALVEEMRARDDVVEVRPHVFIYSGIRTYLKIDGREEKVRIGYAYWDLNDPFTKPPEMLAGDKIDADSRGEIVLAEDALKAFGYVKDADYEGLIGKEVEIVVKAPRGDVESFPFRVKGVLKTWSGMEYFEASVGVDDMMALKSWWFNDPNLVETEGYDMMVVRAKTLNDATQIVAELKAKGFRVESLQVILDTVNKTMVILQTMLGSIGGLALLVASIGIANTMVMAVYERTREIGILKAIGASPGDIRVLFMAESSLIGLLGGVVGVIGGWLLGIALNKGILAYLEWQEIPIEGTFFMVTPWLVVLALLFATVVGLLAGLYPAARAAKMDPLEALRYE